MLDGKDCKRDCKGNDSKWNAEGISSDEIHVAIGPAIGSCCYVVDDRVLTAAEQVVNGSVPYKKFLTDSTQLI